LGYERAPSPLRAFVFPLGRRQIEKHEATKEGARQNFMLALRVARRMSLPMAQPPAQPVQARFAHENGTQLRLQCFVTVRDAQGKVATCRIQGYDGWCIPGESMLVNESPDEAAVRVARSWFVTPLGLQLDRILSYPATGGEDNRWYLLFVYHADAPADLKGTPDTIELAFRGKDEAPAAWAMSHGDVWDGLW
jgi:hypothetical protein